MHKAAHGIIRNFGAALQIGETARCLDHLKLRPAAAISITEGDEAPVGSLFVAHAVTVADAVHALKEAGRVGPHSTVRQGLVSMTGTFIDTIIVCTLTGLSIVMMGSYQVKGIEGVQVTTDAFQKGLSFLPAEVSAFVLMVCLVFFAFTTILGWNYYGERCLEYLTNRNQKAVKVYRWLYILAVFIGPYMTVKAVWTIADIFNGLMAIPNIIALFVLSGVVAKETKEYFKKHKEL